MRAVAVYSDVDRDALHVRAADAAYPIGRAAPKESYLNAARLIEGANGEAMTAFGAPALYVERLVPHARHIEMQILGDARGEVVWLGERDCSIQRRHQKLVEESPAPTVDDELRGRLGVAAVKVAKAVR